jgi:hypothetical protein
MAMPRFGAWLQLIDAAAVRAFDGPVGAEIEVNARMAKRTSTAVASDALLLDHDSFKRL